MGMGKREKWGKGGKEKGNGCPFPPSPTFFPLPLPLRLTSVPSAP